MADSGAAVAFASRPDPVAAFVPVEGGVTVRVGHLGKGQLTTIKSAAHQHCAKQSSPLRLPILPLAAAQPAP
jgi:hypothetical protein